MDTPLPCTSFMELKHALLEMRETDDKIIHRMNTAVPTRSNVDHVDATASCASVYKELTAVHTARMQGLLTCKATLEADIQDMKSSLQPSDVDLRTQQGKGKNDPSQQGLRSQMMFLRQVKREVTAEEILQDQTLKVFMDRCGRYYKPGRH